MYSKSVKLATMAMIIFNTIINNDTIEYKLYRMDKSYYNISNNYNS